MDVAKLFHKVCVLDGSNTPRSFLGCAFPVTPDGGMLTCRHVVAEAHTNGTPLGIVTATGQITEVNEIRFPADASIDVAYIPGPNQHSEGAYFPLLPPKSLLIGEDVHTFGYFAIAGDQSNVEQGYFSGKLVNIASQTSIGPHTITLPFPILEGMSGSPVLTYHNGTKLVGIAHGNRQTRVLSSEVLDYADSDTQYRETINRIVEFGLGYHVATIASVLAETGATDPLVTDQRVSIPGLEG